MQMHMPDVHCVAFARCVLLTNHVRCAPPRTDSRSRLGAWSWAHLCLECGEAYRLLVRSRFHLNQSHLLPPAAPRATACRPHRRPLRPGATAWTRCPGNSGNRRGPRWTYAHRDPDPQTQRTALLEFLVEWIMRWLMLRCVVVWHWFRCQTIAEQCTQEFIW